MGGDTRHLTALWRETLARLLESGRDAVADASGGTAFWHRAEVADSGGGLHDGWVLMEHPPGEDPGRPGELLVRVGAQWMCLRCMSDGMWRRFESFRYRLAAPCPRDGHAARHLPGSPAPPRRALRRGLADAVAAVLEAEGRPMGGAEIAKAVVAQGLWRDEGGDGRKGRNLERAAWNAIVLDIQGRGEASRFRQTSPGRYEFVGRGAGAGAPATPMVTQRRAPREEKEEP
jgi:hypothetical protein